MSFFKIFFVPKFSQFIVGILTLAISVIIFVQIFVHLQEVSYFEEHGYPIWISYLLVIFVVLPIYVGMRVLEKRFIYPVLFTKKERKLVAELDGTHQESKFRKIFRILLKHR